jgi:hypothetical protein
MPISQKIKDSSTTPDRRRAVPLGHAGTERPEHLAQGSMLVYDDEHPPIGSAPSARRRERQRPPRRRDLRQLGAARRRFGIRFLRFYGTAELHESGPVREAIFQRLTKREQEHDGADKGIGVLIKIERAADVRGKPLP